MRFMPVSTGLALLLAPISAFAATAISGCGFVPGLPCGSGGAAGAVAIIANTIIPALQYIFYAVALGFFFYYAVRLILESEDESTINETKTAYGYAITGAVMVSLVDNIVATVGPGYASASLINAAPVNDGVNNVVLFMRLMVATAVTGMIVYQGFRMILLQGQESEMEAQKKKFFNSLLGVVIVQLAFVVVNSFFPGAGSSALAQEIVGIINFLLQLLGALAILGFIVAGIMMVASTDEGLKDRAKKAIFTTIITLVYPRLSYRLPNQSSVAHPRCSSTVSQRGR